MSDHKFKKGKSGNPKGRPKGSQNKLTKTVRETVLATFNELQDDPKHNLLEFAKKHPREFYQIAAKLIPNEIIGRGEFVSKIIIETMTDEQAERVSKNVDKLRNAGNEDK